MDEHEELIEGTLAQEHPESAGLPQMNVDTYASQLFWLVITFGFLFFVLSKFAMPRIGGAIDGRNAKITGDLASAEQMRAEADEALKAYEAALAAARGSALGMAEENRKRITAELDAAKAEADAKAQSALAEAERRIADARVKAEGSIRDAAAGAAVEAVERLIGEKVSAEDAAKAVSTARAGA